MFIYVIAEDIAGPCKIGIGAQPERRLMMLQIGNPRRLSLHYKRLIEHTNPVVVERVAHAAAGYRHQLIGEWFSVSVDEAIAAVDQALSAQASPDEGRGWKARASIPGYQGD